jgi:hypothetical protein
MTWGNGLRSACSGGNEEVRRAKNPLMAIKVNKNNVIINF